MNTINGSIDPMLNKMEEMNVDNFSGLDAMEFREQFVMLAASMKRLAPYFNFKISIKEIVNE